MTVDFQPNPLNIFELRRVDHCPPHFFTVDFHITVGEKKISDWIWANLAGRFYLGETFVFRSGSSILLKRSAFEIHSEASYFGLLLPEINKNSYNF